MPLLSKKSFKILSDDELLSKHFLKGGTQPNKFKIAQSVPLSTLMLK